MTTEQCLSTGKLSSYRECVELKDKTPIVFKKGENEYIFQSICVSAQLTLIIISKSARSTYFNEISHTIKL